MNSNQTDSVYLIEWNRKTRLLNCNLEQVLTQSSVQQLL